MTVALSATAHASHGFRGRAPSFEFETGLDLRSDDGFGVRTLARLSEDVERDAGQAPLFLGVSRSWDNGWIAPHVGYGRIGDHTSTLWSLMGQLALSDGSLFISAEEDYIVRGGELQGRLHVGRSRCFLSREFCAKPRQRRLFYIEYGWQARHEGSLVTTGPYVTAQGLLYRTALEGQVGFQKENRGFGVLVVSAIDLEKIVWLWR